MPQAVTTFTPDMTELQSDNPEVAKLLRENAVLKLIIDIQHSNPLIVNKYIIADDATLIKLVQLLCNATEVNIDADDIECGCTAKNTYRKVHAIFVVVDGQTKNLKYDFSDVMYTLKELHISTKFVYWNWNNENFWEGFRGSPRRGFRAIWSGNRKLKSYRYFYSFSGRLVKTVKRNVDETRNR